MFEESGETSSYRQSQLVRFKAILLSLLVKMVASLLFVTFVHSYRPQKE